MGSERRRCGGGGGKVCEVQRGSDESRQLAGERGRRGSSVLAGGGHDRRRVEHVQSATRGGGGRAGLGRVKEERLEAVVVGAGGVPRGAGEDGPLGKALPVLGDEVGERLLPALLGLEDLVAAVVGLGAHEGRRAIENFDEVAQVCDRIEIRGIEDDNQVHRMENLNGFHC